MSNMDKARAIIDRLEYEGEDLSSEALYIVADALDEAAEENADLRARLQTCQELSGVLPMSNAAALAGRLLLKRLSSFVDSGQAGLPIRLYFSATEAELLVDALRPLFGDAGAALKEQ